MEKRNTYSTFFMIRTARTKKGLSPIYCRITVNKGRTEFAIKRSIAEDQWEDGKAKGNGESARAINDFLKQVDGKIFQYYRELLAQDKLVTAEGLRSMYLGLKEDEQTLLSLFEYHNTELKDTVEWGTLKNYFTTKKYVELFLKEKLRTKDIYLSQLNYKFLVDFELFIKAHKPLDHHKPCGQNTVMKHIERFRKVINIAVKYEWLDKDPFAQFKPKFNKTTRECLTIEQVQAIENKSFSMERLQLVKDLFVFSCYTGLSYIDVMNLSPDNISLGIDGNHWLHTSRKKTDNEVHIPILPKAWDIIEKYKENPKALHHKKLFPSITNQNLNSYLKEIADVCKIEKNLTFHLARHTFATTITLTNGVPIETVSKLLGHSSIRTTQIYAKVIERKVSEDMKALRQKISFTTKTGS